MKKLLIVLAVAAAACAGYVGYQNYSHQNKWQAHTTVNGIDVSNKTFEESKAIFEATAKDYKLDVKARNDGALTIKSSDVDLTITTNKAFKEAFNDQHKSIVFPWQSYDYTANYTVNYDADKLNDIINGSELITGSDTYKITKPVDAHYEYSEDKHAIVIKKEVQGNKLVKKQFKSAIKKAFNNAEHEIDLTDAKKYPDVYKKPSVTSDDKELNDTLDDYNNVALRFINIKITDKITENVTPKEILTLLDVSKGKVKIDDQKVNDFVEKVCLKYKTEGIKRKFKSHTGKTISVSGGDYGWRISYDDLLAKFKSAINKDIDKKDTQAYIDDASKENKKAVTTKITAKMLNTGYTLNLDNKAADYNPNNYTEVDLSAQRVYCFKNGKVVFSCNCITGLNRNGKVTTTGAYYIKQKQYYRVLKGDDYETPVNWWARITWSGIGFHAAPWQNWGAWSPSRYKSVGSHGCVNLSTGNAEKVYKNVSMGECIFIHW